MFEPHVRLPSKLEGASAVWIAVDPDGQVLLDDVPLGNPGFPVGQEPPLGGTCHLLGIIDEATPVWAVGASEIDERSVPSHTWMDLRALFGSVSDDLWALAGRATQVVTWDRDHQYCGRCGSATRPHELDRSRVCPGCGSMAFPRISPAVIMLVERDGGFAGSSRPEVLLAWGRQFPGRFFSALAGFVEPGESLEQCVAREVREETGIEIDQIRYFGSQPWPFPHSLMVGFNARYVSGEIVVQEAEIVEAGWFGPNELPPVPRGGMSIAGWLIEDWLERIDS